MAKQMDKNDWDSPQVEKPEACAVCEAMLPDAVDGLLSESEQKAFDKHVATCTQCSEELTEAQRGAAWLHMLKGHTPEPSPMLLSNILAHTTGAESLAAAPVHDGAAQAGPALQMMPDGTIGPRVDAQKGRENWTTMLSRKLVDIFSIQKATMHFQPRLAMTAAMAFFSVALTLNITGVKLSDVKISNLRPSALRRTVADTSASAMRSFQNMRVVYQFESKLEDIRDTSATNPRTQPTETNAPANGQPNKEQHSGSQDSDQPSPHGHSALEFPLARKYASEQGV